MGTLIPIGPAPAPPDAAMGVATGVARAMSRRQVAMVALPNRDPWPILAAATGAPPSAMAGGARLRPVVDLPAARH